MFSFYRKNISIERKHFYFTLSEQNAFLTVCTRGVTAFMLINLNHIFLLSPPSRSKVNVCHSSGLNIPDNMKQSKIPKF